MPLPPLFPKFAPESNSSVPSNVPGGVSHAELQKPTITGSLNMNAHYQNAVPFGQNTIHAPPASNRAQALSYQSNACRNAAQPSNRNLNSNVAPNAINSNANSMDVTRPAGVTTIGNRNVGSIVTAKNARNRHVRILPRIQPTQSAQLLPLQALPWESEYQPVHQAPAPVPNNVSPSKFISDLVARAISSVKPEAPQPPQPISQKRISPIVKSPFVDVELVTNVQQPTTEAAPPTALPIVSVQNGMPSTLVEQPDPTPLASGNTATTVADEILHDTMEPKLNVESGAPQKSKAKVSSKIVVTNASPKRPMENDAPEKSFLTSDVELDYPRIVDGKLPAGVSLEARAAMLKADAEDELQCFMATTKNAVRMRQDGKKILFEVSLQEFPANTDLDLLKRYYYGKAYRRACLEVANKEYNFKQHLPFLVEHRGSSKFLFCELTRKTLPLDCHVVENHVNSTKYLRLKEEAEKRIAERKRVFEKKRKIAVGERNAKVEARRKDSTEDALLIQGYNSEEDSDFDVNVEETKEIEEDEADSDADVLDPLQQAIMEGNVVPGLVSPVVSSDVTVRNTRPERESKTRAADMKYDVSEIVGYESEEDSDFDPTVADDEDVEMGSEADEIEDPIMKAASSARKAVSEGRNKKERLQRRSKAHAISKVAREAPFLPNDQSSDDDDFNPNKDEPENAESDIEEDQIEVAVTPSKKIKSDTKKMHLETPKPDNGLKHGEFYIYKTVEKKAPPRPVDGHLAEVREKLRKKRDKKKALRKAMKKVSHERKLINRAKRELIIEQERQDEKDDFWTRGKFDVDEEVVRARAFGNDATDDEWTTRQPKPIKGMKRKALPIPRPLKKSRQERMRRLMPGTTVSGSSGQ